MKRLLMTPDNYQVFVDGIKTVTRRLINPQPPDGFKLGGRIFCSLDPSREGNFLWCNEELPIETGEFLSKPYYRPGEKVIVVTRWAVDRSLDLIIPSQIASSESTVNSLFAIGSVIGCELDSVGKWRPSRFLPLHLEPYFPKAEIISVRAERLQDISEEDAILEGARPELGEGLDRNGNYFAIVSHKLGFSLLWNSINAKRGYGWHTNPWVWRIEFKKCEP